MTSEANGDLFSTPTEFLVRRSTTISVEFSSQVDLRWSKGGSRRMIWRSIHKSSADTRRFDDKWSGRHVSNNRRIVGLLLVSISTAATRSNTYMLNTNTKPNNRANQQLNSFAHSNGAYHQNRINELSHKRCRSSIKLHFFYYYEKMRARRSGLKQSCRVL